MEIKITEKGVSCALCGLYIERRRLADGGGYEVIHPKDECLNSGQRCALLPDGTEIPVKTKLGNPVLWVVELLDGDEELEGRFIVSSDVSDLQEYLNTFIEDHYWGEIIATPMVPMSLDELEKDLRGCFDDEDN